MNILILIRVCTIIDIYECLQTYVCMYSHPPLVHQVILQPGPTPEVSVSPPTNPSGPFGFHRLCVYWQTISPQQCKPDAFCFWQASMPCSLGANMSRRNSRKISNSRPLEAVLEDERLAFDRKAIFLQRVWKSRVQTRSVQWYVKLLSVARKVILVCLHPPGCRWAKLQWRSQRKKTNARKPWTVELGRRGLPGGVDWCAPTQTRPTCSGCFGAEDSLNQATSARTRNSMATKSLPRLKRVRYKGLEMQREKLLPLRSLAMKLLHRYCEYSVIT